jgi:hypothetical protein
MNDVAVDPAGAVTVIEMAVTTATMIAVTKARTFVFPVPLFNISTPTFLRLPG